MKMNMKRHSYVRFMTVLIGLLALSPLAEAHYLWIESQPSQGKTSAPSQVEIYYGEFEESLREKAGGRLDEVGPIETWLLNSSEKVEITVQKKENYFETTFDEASTVNPRLIQLQELTRPVQDWRAYDIGIAKPNYYAGALVLGPDADILHLSVPAHKTALGIYPVSLGDELIFQVFFKDTPFSNAKFNVHAPNGWSKEYKTDESGAVRFKLPWAGQYVFEVINLEKPPGVFQGVSYEAIRHRATFSWKAPGPSR